MACKITYKGIRYNSLEELYADAYKNSKSLEPPQQDLSQQQVKPFDAELAKKIQQKLQELYPEIQLNITNNPVWEKGDNVFNQQEFDNEINFRLKTTKVILDNYNKIKQWESNKSINQETLYKKIGELGISKQQLELLKESEGNTIETKLANFVANYSYTVEINTSKKRLAVVGADRSSLQFSIENSYYSSFKHAYLDEFVFTKNDKKITKEEYDIARKLFQKKYDETLIITNTNYYSNPTVNLTVPGGTNYTENEIATPAITPSIKGHARFATDKGIGWFRSDDKTVHTGNITEGNRKAAEAFDLEPEADEIVLTKTRRILEVQSDLFQKGRDKEQLMGIDFDLQGVGYTFGSRNQYQIIDEFDGEITFKDIETKEVYKKPKEWLKEQNKKAQINKSENQFLQLLNKNNNWVTFFVKSIIQDSAKKGYEKVLFPRLDTIIQIESAGRYKSYADAEKAMKHKEWHERDKELHERDKELRKILAAALDKPKEDQNQEHILRLQKQILILQEQIASHQPSLLNTAKFYENTVTNILKKQGYNSVLITDEYDNTWNEVNINQARDLAEVLLQRNNANQIIGQANIKAMTVLVDAINQKQDTLPHEYAHHYIAWFRNTPIVQEAIKKWGSEEALVQSIGEQVVKQRGEAYNWWNSFVKWIMNKFNSLSSLQKEELTQILTDAFLTRQNLNQQQVKPGVEELFESNPELSSIGTPQQYSQYLDSIFPDSKVKDIVYHGTNKDFSEFISGKGFWGNAFYVTTEKGYANSIAASRARQEPGTSKIIKPLFINANNIEFIEDAYAIDEFPKNIDTILTNIEGGGKIIYAVKNPEQIHILGSKQDIEGFKKFVSQPTRKPASINPEQFPSALQEAIDAMIMLDPTRDIQSIIDELTMDGTINQECN